MNDTTPTTAIRDLIAWEFSEFLHQEGARQRPGDFADWLLGHLTTAGYDVLPGRRHGTSERGDGVDLPVWAADRAKAFRTFEDREMAMYPDDAARDTALVEWVLRTLARPENPGTDQVLEAIDRQRAVAS